VADYERVSQGEPLTLSAATWNAVLEAAEHYSRRKLGAPQQAPVENDPLTPAVRCMVKNDTGADLAEFSVVKITTPPILPTGRTLDAQGYPIFSGILIAAAADNFAIVVDAIPAGEMGRAVVMGLCVCTVNVLVAGDKFAVPVAGTSTLLNSATSSGPARIVWTATASTGSQLGIVMLTGAGAVPAASALDVRNTDGTAVDANTTSVRVNKATGHVVSGTGGTSQFDGLDASASQIGHVNLSPQAVGKDVKTITDGHIHIARGGYYGTGNSGFIPAVNATILSSYSASIFVAGGPNTIKAATYYLEDTVSGSVNWSAVAQLVNARGLSFGGSPETGGISFGTCVAGGFPGTPWGTSNNSGRGFPQNGLPEGAAGYAATYFGVENNAGNSQFVICNSGQAYWGWRGTLTWTIGYNTVKQYFAGGIIYRIDVNGIEQPIGTGIVL
jgi:hypothetical protein